MIKRKLFSELIEHLPQKEKSWDSKPQSSAFLSTIPGSTSSIHRSLIPPKHEVKLKSDF